jgi:ATP-dependent Clp protease ATP-binding subunit ClpC
MDALLGWILLCLFATGIYYWLRPHYRRFKESRKRRRGYGGSRLKTTLEEARTVGLELGWDDLSIDRLARHKEAQEQIEILRDPEIPFVEVQRLAKSEQIGVSVLGLATIAQRDDVPVEWTTEAVRLLSSVSNELEPFVYETLIWVKRPVIGLVMSKLDEGIDWSALARFIEKRRERKQEVVDLDTFKGNLPGRFVPTVELFIDRYENYLGDDFRGFYEEWKRIAVDLEFLGQLGRVLEPPYDQPAAYLSGRRGELVELIQDALEQTPRRSVLLVGEHGVGKSRLARAALDRMSEQYVVFEASASEINAGAMWVGELEGRIKDLAEKVQGHAFIWLLPGFDEALYAGQHARSPMGMLDALLPHVDRGEITLIGEISSAGLERLMAERPRVAGAFDIVRVRPLDEETTIAVAEHKLESEEFQVSKETLIETYDLAQQFLPHIASPGNLLRLVDVTITEVEEEGRREFEISDVLAALAASSGLPLAMLDPNAPLELAVVQRFFESRVLAQPEAVETIVERISMIKAGLTDPTRPLAVFLFIGPTGTGKTEIAKTLAEFLFGSERRLVRLDMSEFQTPDALDRLLSEPSVEGRGSVLMSSVRKDPFAVILLDEFEKAAAPIWDLFLQVFDDGRLTDHQGRTADFRRSVIILTSNVGSAFAHKPGLGFEAKHGSFREELIEAELKRTFRVEFLNRIDQVVVFQPFERAEMRALLEKELADALARRGLRSRPWAIELDESAIAFLVDKGFSPELGARPLKRALDKHLLTKIAKPIVEQAVPEGDQFLFVSAEADGIEVSFVDPDASESAASERDADAETPAAFDLRALALHGQSEEKAARYLLEELGRVRSAVEGGLRERKDAALEAMQDPGFWDDEGRFAVLHEAEYLDRLEAAFTTTSRLGDRLARHSDKSNGAGDLTELVSLRLYVLNSAIEALAEGETADLFLRLRSARADDETKAAQWAADLAGMYEAWGKRRGMRLERLDETEHLYAVSGLGVGTILAPEAGLHLLELAEQSGTGERVERLHMQVELAPRPLRPRGDGPLAAEARGALEQAPSSTAVVRRYRFEPAPLVRDAVRGYRTGRIDRVLAGDFDLF